MPKKPSTTEVSIIPVEQIGRHIFLIRGHKVMLDSDLAELYQVPTKAFNQAVKRNTNRFPPDFMFRLTKAELENWRSQIVTSNPGAKMGLRRPPYAFTEHGVAMLSSILNSDRAIAVNIAIVRAFIQLRQLLATNRDLAQKIEALERKVGKHDADLQAILRALQQLLQPPVRPGKHPMGFVGPGKN